MEIYKFRIHPETCDNCLYSSKWRGYMIPWCGTFTFGELFKYNLEKLHRQCSIDNSYYEITHHCKNYKRCF